MGGFIIMLQKEPSSSLRNKGLFLLFVFLSLGCGSLVFVTTIAHAADPLPSWNGRKAKQSIVVFVEKVTKEGSPDFVTVPERIAAFDNDGTLWAEQPMYFQMLFALDRVKALAPKHLEWKTQEGRPLPLDNSSLSDY